jgi:hypothetical protein
MGGFHGDVMGFYHENMGISWDFAGFLYDFYMIWGMKQVQYLPRTNWISPSM